IIGDKGQISFSVFTYDPIVLCTSEGRQEFSIPNPEHVQQPLIQQVVEHLLKTGTCTLDSVSATSVNWVMDKILGKL
ncbi:MAG: gfo/Idh/MocA family oxidoreductase, partial [Paludibacteraceae bacterium]|nr:gfo/Idh/MocA family oxidoreductase [Paludibacteraceae bacterium]